MFVFGPGDKNIQEVLSFDENKRSWFIDENVKSDGKMHLSTPIDPMFLILPYLRKVLCIKVPLRGIYRFHPINFLFQTSQVKPLDQLLLDSDFPETSRIARCQNLKLLSVADRKGEESLQAYKYNEEKTFAWLQKKVERVANVLKQKGIHVAQGAVSANYVKSSKHESGSETGTILFLYDMEKNLI